MKNCTEITESLLERRSKYLAEKKAKKKKILGVVATCCCLGVVVSLVALVGMGEDSSAILPVEPGKQASDSNETEKYSYSAAAESTTEGKTVTENGNKGSSKGKNTKKGDKVTASDNLSESDNEEIIVNGDGAGTTRCPKNDGSYDKNLTEAQSTTNKNETYIQKIVVTRMPNKTVYYLGDRFDFAGLQIMGYFADGAVVDITNEAQLGSEVAGGVSNEYRITVEYVDNTEALNLAYTEFYVVVKAPSLKLSSSSLTLSEGASGSLTAFTEASGCDITWHTTDPSVAVVDENGNVTAVGAGTASVYAELSYNSYNKTSGYCNVIVISEVVEAEQNY